MELKLPKEVKLLGLSLKYQSYLYGIEIVQHVLQIVYASVSIVPLWNWNTAIRLLSCRGQLAYQSYLYGIEIAVAPAHETGTALYQSYLYGIEIFYSFNHLLKFILVSIVPLWNWNLIILLRPLLITVYQSYLYGIEIYVKVCYVMISNVSIVPLWNWNSPTPIFLQRVDSINRTFMELKFLDSGSAVARLSKVSIVPLWNWNFSNVIALLGMISINRTFMELKSKEIYEKEGISPQYQSYLYGIEICLCQVTLTGICVSIVPLWNWN